MWTAEPPRAALLPEGAPGLALPGLATAVSPQGGRMWRSVWAAPRWRSESRCPGRSMARLAWVEERLSRAALMLGWAQERPGSAWTSGLVLGAAHASFARRRWLLRLRRLALATNYVHVWSVLERPERPFGRSVRGPWHRYLLTGGIEHRKETNATCSGMHLKEVRDVKSGLTWAAQSGMDRFYQTSRHHSLL